MTFDLAFDLESEKQGQSSWLRRGERDTSVHWADTFTAVFGKTVGYAPENAGAFLVWQTIVQRLKLQNVCNRIGENW